MHDLLHGEIVFAIRHNLLAVISIPYLILGAYLELNRDKPGVFARWRSLFYGRTSILFILGLFLVYSILRNLSVYPW